MADLYKSDEELIQIVENNEQVDTSRGSDIKYVDARFITIEPGFNVRDFNTEKVQEHIEELKLNISENGVLQPLEVVRNKIGESNGEPIYKYVVVDGQCRLTAVLRLIEEGHSEIVRVPVLLTSQGGNVMNRIVSMITKNEGLRFTPIELAKAYDKLRKVGGWTDEEIAKKMGKSISHVKETLGYLEYSFETQQALVEKKINANTIKTLENQVKTCLEKRDGESRRAEVEKRLQEALEKARIKTLENEESGKAEVVTAAKIVREEIKTKTEEQRLEEAVTFVLGYILPFKEKHESIDVLEALQAQLKAGASIKWAINSTFGKPKEII